MKKIGAQSGMSINDIKNNGIFYVPNLYFNKELGVISEIMLDVRLNTKENCEKVCDNLIGKEASSLLYGELIIGFVEKAEPVKIKITVEE